MPDLHIPIDPVPASRPRVSRWGTYYGKTYTRFRKDVEAYLKTLKVTPTLGALAVTLLISVRRPKSSKLGMPKPDVDNYAKAVLDSLNGVAWEDDSQIETLTVTKQWSDSPGIHVGIRLSGDPSGTLPCLSQPRPRQQRRQPGRVR